MIRITGIPEAVAREVRETMRAPDHGHPAHKALAQGYGPCRLRLRTFRVGADERILFTYNPSLEPCARYDSPELPPDIRALPGRADGSWRRNLSPHKRPSR